MFLRNFKNQEDAYTAGKLWFRSHLKAWFILTPESNKKEFCKEHNCEYLLKEHNKNKRNKKYN